MLIFIFILKLIEFCFYIYLPNSNTPPEKNIIIVDTSILDTSLCIGACVFSVIIFIIICYCISKKVNGRNRLIYLSIMLTVITTIIALMVVVTFRYNYLDIIGFSYPLNLRISRSIGLFFSIILCIFCIKKATKADYDYKNKKVD